MPFRPKPKMPKFADLKGILSQTQIDENLYQTIQILIERLEQLRDATVAEVAGGGEVGTGLIPHAPTHYELGSDPVDIKQLDGYPGGITDFLRGDKTFAPVGAAGGMEYLGPFVAGPVYNDGDIVVASDDIAYVCVKNGTTTPPEPWPGVGLVPSAVADAKYWVSEPHATLTQEVDFGAKANGYVKSIVTAGISNPITVAVIPLTDGGTGASDAATARTNLGLGTMAVQNANAVAITGGSITGPTGINTSSNIVTTGTMLASVISSSGTLHANGNITTNAQIFSTSTIQAGGGFFGDGSNITNLNASSLAFGTVAPARMGSGVADPTTFLRGDGVWAVPSLGSGVPSGMIALFDTACPAGWTRFALLDGRYPRGAAAFTGVLFGTGLHGHGSITGAGGSHGHGVSVSGTTGLHAPGTFEYDHGGSSRQAAATHDHSVNVVGTTDVVGDHQHSITDENVIPPSVDMVYCKKD